MDVDNAWPVQRYSVFDSSLGKFKHTEQPYILTLQKNTLTLLDETERSVEEVNLYLDVVVLSKPPCIGFKYFKNESDGTIHKFQIRFSSRTIHGVVHRCLGKLVRIGDPDSPAKVNEHDREPVGFRQLGSYEDPEKLPPLKMPTPIDRSSSPKTKRIDESGINIDSQRSKTVGMASSQGSSATLTQDLQTIDLQTKFAHFLQDERSLELVKFY